MLKTYLILIAATFFEVAGTMLLPVTKGFSKLIPTGFLIVFYTCAFFCLSIVVTKLPLAVVYATWCGLGIFIIVATGVPLSFSPLNGDHLHLLSIFSFLISIILFISTIVKSAS